MPKTADKLQDPKSNVRLSSGRMGSMNNMNANKEMVKRMSKNHNNIKANSSLNGGEDPKTTAAAAGK